MGRAQSTKRGRRRRVDAEARLPDGSKLKARFWLERKGEMFLASGRVALLEEIGRCGSISGAARQIGMSYRHAWLLAERMNRLAAKDLFITSATGARLTEEGRRVIKLFHDLSKDFKKRVLT